MILCCNYCFVKSLLNYHPGNLCHCISYLQFFTKLPSSVDCLSELKAKSFLIVYTWENTLKDILSSLFLQAFDKQERLCLIDDYLLDTTLWLLLFWTWFSKFPVSVSEAKKVTFGVSNSLKKHCFYSCFFYIICYIHMFILFIDDNCTFIFSYCIVI